MRSRRLSVENDSPTPSPSPSEETPAPVAATFAALGVMPSLVDPLAERGIATPFPVQQMAIPVALTGADLIGQARTGTGKTLAFGLPLLQRIVSPDEPDYADLAAPGAPQALVVTPTRELALQVATDLELASSKRRVRVLTV